MRSEEEVRNRLKKAKKLTMKMMAIKKPSAFFIHLIVKGPLLAKEILLLKWILEENNNP